MYSVDSLMQVIASGVLERSPKLDIVLVETEVSWIPSVMYQWDRYFAKRNRSTGGLTLLPSEYFKRQVYATFFNDQPAGYVFPHWGVGNCMWSNDFPHPNSTWPNSRDVIQRDWGGCPAPVRISSSGKPARNSTTCALLNQWPLSPSEKH